MVAGRHLDFSIAILVAMFPVLFWKIFGRLPLESLRRDLALREMAKHGDVPLNTSATAGEVEWGLKLPLAKFEFNRAEAEVLMDSIGSNELAEASAKKLFTYY